MDDENLERELTELGARWRAENSGTSPELDTLPRRGTGQRRWALVSVATAAAVAVAIGGGLLLRPDSPDRAPAGAPDPAPALTDRLDCAVPPTHEVAGAPVVPDGAVAARLCGSNAGTAGFRTAWPVDTLTGAAAAKISQALNRLPRATATGDCGTTRPFDLVLRYRDGDRVRVTTSGACDGLTVVGGGTVTGASGMSSLVLDLIDQRREASGLQPPTPVPAQCPVHWKDLASTYGAAPVHLRDAVAVTACQYRLTAGLASPGRASGALDFQSVVNNPAAILGAALDGISDDPCHGRSTALQPVQRVLLVRDGFGDLQIASTAPCWPNTLSGLTQYASDSFATQLTELFARTTS